MHAQAQTLTHTTLSQIKYSKDLGGSSRKGQQYFLSVRDADWVEVEGGKHRELLFFFFQDESLGLLDWRGGKKTFGMRFYYVEVDKSIAEKSTEGTSVICQNFAANQNPNEQQNASRCYKP